MMYMLSVKEDLLESLNKEKDSSIQRIITNV